MARVLLLATTTGYQTRSFGEAAERLGIDLVFATDRCHLIEDPWQDGAVPIRFYDELSAVEAILASATARPIDGVLAVGDRPTVIAARVMEALGLPGHPPDAARIARHKQQTRERLRASGLPVPRFVATTVDESPEELAELAVRLGYPVVVKPVALSGSRGVMRADDPSEFVRAFGRLRALLRLPDIQAERNDAHESILVETFIPGREYAVEGLLDRGRVHVLTIFDKPDPLDGPFFEETIYLTPSQAPPDTQRAVVAAVTNASQALGLAHGPIHAECRVHPGTGAVYVLEVAARPIGGLCARALRFRGSGRDSARSISLEELLLRHAIGEPSGDWRREDVASGVMMIPIPRTGVLRHVEGVERARAVPGVDDVRITAKLDQKLVPLPEGSSYLGFIFARATHPAEVDAALRRAHADLIFAIDPDLRVLTDAVQSRHG
jgi:biotin carboxylase